MARLLATLQNESDVTFEVTTVKELPKTDIARINELENELYLNDIQYTRKINKTHAKLLENYIVTVKGKTFPKDTVVALVRSGERVEGFAVAMVRDKFGFIKSIYIDPKFRGKGYGKALITSILEDRLSKSVVSWKIGVSIGNDSAKKLYESLGFRTSMETMLMTV